MTVDAKVPDTRIGIATGLPGHVKVMLRYLTKEPKHLRSMLLSQYTGVIPPYIEEVCILLPHMRVFPVIECFLPIFEVLKKEGIIQQDAELQDFKLLDRDYLTISYGSFPATGRKSPSLSSRNARHAGRSLAARSFATSASSAGRHSMPPRGRNPSIYEHGTNI